MTVKLKALEILKHCLLFARHRYFIKKRVFGAGNSVRINSFCVGTTIDILGDNNAVTILGGCFIEGLTIYIRGSNISVFIENNVCFRRGGASLWLEDEGSSISIGKNSTFFGDVHLASTESAKISIGSDCLIAPAVQIRNGDSHAIYSGEERCNIAKQVNISSRVWIGEGAVILKGVSISSDSVVATRAVVTKSCHLSGSVLAGNPARQVKTGITWSADRKPKRIS